MKMNKISRMLIVVLLVVLVAIFLYGSGKYSREAYVENNNGEEIIFTDVRGHRWGWFIETIEEHSLKPGNKVILFFDTNGTDEIIEDDILKKVKILNK